MNYRNPFFPRHAHVFKGGGGGGSSQPAQAKARTATDAIDYETARDYFKSNVYKGDAAAFTDPWNQSFNEWTMGLESQYGVDSYKNLSYGQLTGQAGAQNTIEQQTITQDAAFNNALLAAQKRYEEGMASQQQRSDAMLNQIKTGYEQQMSLLAGSIASAKAAPPAADRATDLMQTNRTTRRRAARRKGLFSTQGAGETGGYSGGQQRSLLGQATA